MAKNTTYRSRKIIIHFTIAVVVLLNILLLLDEFRLPLQFIIYDPIMNMHMTDLKPGPSHVSNHS